MKLNMDMGNVDALICSVALKIASNDFHFVISSPKSVASISFCIDFSENVLFTSRD